MDAAITFPEVTAEIVAGDALKLLDVARQFGVHSSTVLRWLLRGLPDGRGERIRLAAVKRGKTWLTSRAALERFLEALPHSAPTSGTPPIRTPTKRERDSARATAALKNKYGV